ncbi:hypothetical protein BBW65_04055 [Helicobacter enhydrae]|uniref:Methyltransferase, TIGR04325 family n=1 Tax=Helicobacter enhydrae TaxID=222136 RepID=A0A1B1U5F0_9HELI|nr:methyltransferase, TIGR04325 family [Helicobacter enhydrae]ANV98024.1 hypothetical protein BBW65_04055 [Helicobacter enhydrae]
MKTIFKKLCPPIIKDCFNLLLQRNIQWTGNYTSWQEAQTNAIGYDPNMFIHQLVQSAKIARDDEEKVERDSLIFNRSEVTYPYPLLSNLFAFCTHTQAQSLFILDLGGSLGSLYYQNRKFLSLLPKFTWNILEQEQIIQIGKKEFQNHTLFFHSSYQEAGTRLKASDTKILVLSSVLQYLEKPFETLKPILEYFDFDCILVDRTPFSTNHQARIAIQKVPKRIYHSSYPCHLFSKHFFLDFFQNFTTSRGGGYDLFDEFDSYIDCNQKELFFLGFAFKRREQCLKN